MKSRKFLEELLHDFQEDSQEWIWTGLSKKQMKNEIQDWFKELNDNRLAIALKKSYQSVFDDVLSQADPY